MAIETKTKTSKSTLLKNQAAFSCPMCGSGKTSRKAKIENYRFLNCEHCEFIFSPEITPEYLSELYANGYHGPEDGAPVTGWSDTSFLDPAFKLLEQRENLHMLDFGTGQSLVPKKLREQGHKVVAVDVAPPVHPHHNRLTGDLIELELDADQFDLIFSFQVLEHLPRPRPVIDELLRLAKPEGLVLIHTDMETPERYKKDFENWWYVAPPDHCAFYRHKTFENYFEGSSHELVWKDEKRVIIKKAKNPKKYLFF